ncbi:MAG: hypothetical protein WAO58_13520 [Fimbriimonadaceae bacterium]
MYVSQLLSFLGVTIEQVFAVSMLSGLGLALILFATVGRMRLGRIGRTGLMGRVSRIAPKTSYPTPNTSAERLPAFLPAAVGISITLFGVFGLCLRVLIGLEPWPSVFGALGLSIVLFAWLVRATQRLLANTGKPMEGCSLVGMIAHVSLTIPAEGVGSIAYSAEGKRHTIPARAQHPIEKGMRVLVTDLRDRIAVVEEF